MNYICIQCGESFSVTADQFGKRGKCPHCRATILMPRFRENYQAGAMPELRPPSLWLDHFLAALITLSLHLLIVAAILWIPWKAREDGVAGGIGPVLIAELPSFTIAERPPELSLSTEMLSPSRTSLQAVWDESLQLPSQADSPPIRSESNFSAAFGGMAGNLSPERPQPTGSLAAGGQESFEELVNRLKQEGLDITLTFDSTGSMGGEIQQVKQQIERIGSLLIRLVPKTRISICTYRDRGDKFLATGLPLTENLSEVAAFLEPITAEGGGDEPEAVQAGLRWAIEHNTYRRQARKMILIFGDAPPHASAQTECLKLASDFRRVGGIVSTVTCRSARRLEPFVEIAQLGGGESFLTSNEREIMSQLVVLVFGSEHRAKVLELFQLMSEQ